MRDPDVSLILCIHRGAKEIGGSCVEVKSGHHRILIDIGIPLPKSRDGLPGAEDVRSLDALQLVRKGVLPVIQGAYPYDTTCRPVDGLFISHAHADHCGFFGFIRNDVTLYIGEGTRRLIEAGVSAPGTHGSIRNYCVIQHAVPVQIGPFTVTPFLMDHSAFDAYVTCPPER